MNVLGFAAAFRSSGRSAARVLRRRLARRSRMPIPADEELVSDPFGWQTVTILASPQQVAPAGRLPVPLADLAELIETRLEPAPGNRGTQLSARTKPGPRITSASWKGEDPARGIRTALQHSRQLIEVGEVLSIEPQPAGKRRRPASGLLVDLMTGDSDQEGAV